MQDKNQIFISLLHDAHITQKELSEIFNLTPTAISRWHKIGVPQYAQAYLLLRAENIRLKRELDKQKAAVIPK